jgi:hypothetical protein
MIFIDIMLAVLPTYYKERIKMKKNVAVFLSFFGLIMDGGLCVGSMPLCAEEEIKERVAAYSPAVQEKIRNGWIDYTSKEVVTQAIPITIFTLSMWYEYPDKALYLYVHTPRLKCERIIYPENEELYAKVRQTINAHKGRLG